jgi:ferredoxin-NADP reductase
MSHRSKIMSITSVTHDVRCLRLEKPPKYSFIPGQATDVAIDKPGWTDQKRPFTFTSLNSDPYLEFTIKCYSDREGVTREIGRLAPGDELLIDDPWGAIRYKGEGYFIAGGAGITPFLAIFRQLHQVGLIGKNRLFFSSKTAADIIYREELLRIFEDKVVFVITDKPNGPQNTDFIDKAFLQGHIRRIDSCFYVCGPDQMVQEINDILLGVGVDAQSLVFEK